MRIEETPHLTIEKEDRLPAPRDSFQGVFVDEAFQPVPDDLKKSLAVAKRQSWWIEEQYESQVRLLEVALKQVTANRDLLQTKHNMVQEAIERSPDAYTTPEVEYYQSQLKAIGPAVEQMRELLDLYRKLGNNLDFAAAEPMPVVGHTSSHEPADDESRVASGTLPSKESRPSLPLRTPEEFQRSASEARVSIERLQNRMHTKDEYEGLRRDLASAQQHLNLIRAEFGTQLRLLQLEVDRCQAAFHNAEFRYRTVDDANKAAPGTYAKSEVIQYQLASDQARVRLEQAKALLHLYCKAGETPELQPQVAESTNDKPTEQPE